MMTLVFIMAETVFGIDGFWAECSACPDWRCHKRMHESQEQAVRCAEWHADTKHA